MADSPPTLLPDAAIIRDTLALDRTQLANERTLLSYIRTALALVISGASCIHFIVTIAGRLGGSVLIAFGVGLMLFGLYRWARVRRDIQRFKHPMR